MFNHLFPWVRFLVVTLHFLGAARGARRNPNCHPRASLARPDNHMADPPQPLPPGGGGGDDLNNLLHYSLSISFDPLTRCLRGLTAASSDSAAAVAALRAEMRELRDRSAAQANDDARTDVAALREEVRALAERLVGASRGGTNAGGLDALRAECAAELGSLRREMAAAVQAAPGPSAAPADAGALSSLQSRVDDLAAEVAALRAALLDAAAASAAPAPSAAGEAIAVAELRAEMTSLRQQLQQRPSAAAVLPAAGAGEDVAACLAASERTLAAVTHPVTADSGNAAGDPAPSAASGAAPLLSRLRALADAARPLATAADVAAAAASARAAAEAAAALASSADAQGRRIAALETHLARLEQATAAAAGTRTPPHQLPATAMRLPSALPSPTAPPRAVAPAAASAHDLALLRADVAALVQRLDGGAKQQQQALHHQQQPPQLTPPPLAAPHGTVAVPVDAVASLRAELVGVNRRLRALEARPPDAPARRPRSEPAGRSSGSSSDVFTVPAAAHGGAFTGRPLVPDPLHCVACGDTLVRGAADAVRGPWLPPPSARPASAQLRGSGGARPSTVAAPSSDDVTCVAFEAMPSGDTAPSRRHTTPATATTAAEAPVQWSAGAATTAISCDGSELQPSRRRSSLAWRAAASPAAQFLRVTPLQQQGQPPSKPPVPSAAPLGARPQTAWAALPSSSTAGATNTTTSGSRRGSLPRTSAVYVYPHPGVHTVAPPGS